MIWTRAWSGVVRRSCPSRVSSVGGPALHASASSSVIIMVAMMRRRLRRWAIVCSLEDKSRCNLFRRPLGSQGRLSSIWWALLPRARGRPVTVLVAGISTSRYQGAGVLETAPEVH